MHTKRRRRKEILLHKWHRLEFFFSITRVDTHGHIELIKVLLMFVREIN